MLTVVALYGVTIVVFGLSETMWLSLLALAAGGGVDMVSVVLRQTILPLVTPDELRGRVNAVEMVFISASNELGAFESGVAAALIGAVPAVVIGGVATIAVAALWWRLFPGLRARRPAGRAPAGERLDLTQPERRATQARAARTRRTTIVGILGAIVGGAIAKALGFGDPIDEFFDLSTWIAAILGAAALLVVWGMVTGRNRRVL